LVDETFSPGNLAGVSAAKTRSNPAASRRMTQQRDTSEDPVNRS
jgi:hypothetical protein